MKEIIQQGDVILNKLSSLPQDITTIPSQNGEYILFEGEHTGHLHAFEATQPVSFFINKEGRRFLEVKEATPLWHHGHYARTILPGYYEINRVQEVDPYTEEIRKVVD